MTTSLVDAESVIALDIGSVHTRALLFDMVDGQYRFIAAGTVPTTAGAPYHDVGRGVQAAILRLQAVTARNFYNKAGQLQLPSLADGTGIDQIATVFSAGPDLRLVTIGLLETVSVESVNRLAATTYGQVMESIGLNDRRPTDAQIDAILKAEPDLIILAGGTDQGATRSIAKMVDLISLTLQVLPRDKRPDVVYTGNQAIAKRLKEVLSKLTNVHVAPNVRPTIDVEDLDPAQEVLSQVITTRRTAQVGGLAGVASQSTMPLLPAAEGLGRMVKFLSQTDGVPKRVLGIDLGASYTTTASASNGVLQTSTLKLGIGLGLSAVMQSAHLPEVTRWLPMHVNEADVRDYLWQRTLYPSMQPMTTETLAIEQAMVRQALRAALQGLQNTWADLPASYDLIVASNSILAQGSTQGQALLAILDGLQPTGISTIMLDTYDVLPALGAIAAHNALLPVQALESSALLNLGAVISPICSAPYGTVILKVKVEKEGGETSTLEIRQGTLTVLPVQAWQTVKVHLEPQRRMILNPGGKEKLRSFKMTGGVCGVIIDARGRPLDLPEDAPRRRDMIKKWVLSLGG